VGSPDPQDDVIRAKAIREEIGDENFLMMDAVRAHGSAASSLCTTARPRFTSDSRTDSVHLFLK
jgi:L-alanine-DL-glutamate epimerase-like enolase superfamily enzyme